MGLICHAVYGANLIEYDRIVVLGVTYHPQHVIVPVLLTGDLKVDILNKHYHRIEIPLEILTKSDVANTYHLLHQRDDYRL